MTEDVREFYRGRLAEAVAVITQGVEEALDQGAHPTIVTIIGIHNNGYNFSFTSGEDALYGIGVMDLVKQDLMSTARQQMETSSQLNKPVITQWPVRPESGEDQEDVAPAFG